MINYVDLKMREMKAEKSYTHISGGDINLNSNKPRTVGDLKKLIEEEFAGLPDDTKFEEVFCDNNVIQYVFRNFVVEDEEGIKVYQSYSEFARSLMDEKLKP